MFVIITGPKVMRPQAVVKVGTSGAVTLTSRLVNHEKVHTIVSVLQVPLYLSKEAAMAKADVDIIAKAGNAGGLVQYQEGSIVSREILRKETGTVTLFAFDKGQGLSERPRRQSSHHDLREGAPGRSRGADHHAGK
jgi:nucleoside phosphorylase